MLRLPVRVAARAVRGPISARSMSSSHSPSEYCFNIVKKVDYENFLCLLLLKGDDRRAAFAIRAFNAELSLVRDQISKAEIGQGRIVFWREAINRMYSGRNSPEHPVLQELQWLINTAPLTQQWFLRLIDSREKGLKDAAFATLDDAEQYADFSCSPVLYLQLEARGMKRIDADHTASHLGKAQGLTNLVRGVPFNASKGRCLLPLDLLAKHSVSQHQILRTSQTNLDEVIFEIASIANLHLDKTEQELKKLPRSVHDIYLPVVPLRSFLKKLQKANFDVFDANVQVRNSMLPWHLWKHTMRTRFRWF